jgi:hypothetical protein
MNPAYTGSMKTNRKHNYRAPSRPQTVERQAEILEWLRLFADGFTVTEMASALGVSRQLCLYLVKKMVAAGDIVMVLGPCAANAGVQFRLWDEQSLASYYALHGIQHPFPKGVPHAA